MHAESLLVPTERPSRIPYVDLNSPPHSASAALRSDVNRTGSGWSGVAWIIVLLSTIGVMTAQEGDHWRTRRNSDLTLQSTSLIFGIVAVGDSKALSTTLVNNSVSSVAITRAVATEPDFKIESPSLPLTLAAGESASVKVSFHPKANGMYTGHLIIGSDNTYQSAVASLSGSSAATSQLSVSPTNVNFGNVQVGGNQTQPVILTNSGSAGLTISQATIAGTGFKLSGMTVPMALSAGQER